MDYFDLLNIPEVVPYTPQEMYDAMHLGDAPAGVRNKILDDIAFQDQISRLKRLTDNFSKDQEFTVRSEAYLNPNAKEITWDITEGDPGDAISGVVPPMKVPKSEGFTAPVNRVTHNHPTNLLGHKIKRLAPPSALDYGSVATESIVSAQYPNMTAPKWTVMGRDADGSFNGYDFGVSKIWDGPLSKRIPRAIDIVKDNASSAMLDAGFFKPDINEAKANDIIEQRRALLDKSKGLITHPLGQGFAEKPFSLMEEAILPLAPTVAAIGSGLAYNKVRKQAVDDTVRVAKNLPLPLVGGALGITRAMINNNKKFNVQKRKFGMEAPCATANFVFDPSMLWDMGQHAVGALTSGIGAHMTPIIGAMGAMGAANARGAAAAKVAREGATIGEAIAEQKVKAERYKNLAIGGTLAAGGGGLLLGGKLKNDKYRTGL